MPPDTTAVTPAVIPGQDRVADPSPSPAVGGLTPWAFEGGPLAQRGIASPRVVSGKGSLVLWTDLSAARRASPGSQMSLPSIAC